MNFNKQIKKKFAWPLVVLSCPWFSDYWQRRIPFQPLQFRVAIFYI